jgi:hypothetical protein
MYGTASEHSVLYHHQISGAKDLVMGMIQTESPYFQPSPPKLESFKLGKFPNDPEDFDCEICTSSWAVRIIDSRTVSFLGAGMFSLHRRSLWNSFLIWNPQCLGLYSWFRLYSQECLKTNNCQEKALYVEHSDGLWLVNLVTKAIVQSISPLGQIPIYARDNRNEFASSLLGWFHAENNTIGSRNFTGFHLYEKQLDGNLLNNLPSSC